MKNIINYTIGFFLMIVSFTLNGQHLTYAISQIEYEGEMVKTINIKLEPKPETIKDSFEDWMDDKYDVDLDGKSLLFFNKEFMSAKGVVIKEISPSKIDLLVKVDDSNSQNTTLDVFASYGYNNWITPESHPSEFITLENIVYEFIATYLPEYYMERVEETQEKLVDLKEDKEDINDEVEENRNKIKELVKENDELMIKLRENQRKINLTKSQLQKKKKDYKVIKQKVQF